MAALNIRDIGDDRKAALDAEAKARNLPVSELVRRFLDEGIARSRSARAQQDWLAAAKDGLAFEDDELRRHGPSLARHREFTRTGNKG